MDAVERIALMRELAADGKVLAGAAANAAQWIGEPSAQVDFLAADSDRIVAALDELLSRAWGGSLDPVSDPDGPHRSTDRRARQHDGRLAVNARDGLLHPTRGSMPRRTARNRGGSRLDSAGALCRIDAGLPDIEWIPGG
jgi:hypothetical protein